MTNSLERIAAILAGKDFGIEGPVEAATVLRSLPHWDSLKTLLFLMAVEKEFVVEIKPEEIAGLVTLADVCKKIG